MLISVVFPAPFSPRSACASPARRVRSTRSLATTPGKRLVMPFSSSSGGSTDGSRGDPSRSEKETGPSVGADAGRSAEDERQRLVAEADLGDALTGGGRRAAGELREP